MSYGVIGFVAQNENNILQDFSGGHTYQFKQMGYEAVIVDLKRPDSSDTVKDFFSRHEVLFGYGYAGIGAHLTIEGESLWDRLNIPFLSLLYDHPFYHPSLHSPAAGKVCNCYGIQDFMEIRRDFITSPNPYTLLKVSSAGYADPLDADWVEVAWKDRDIYGIFVKSGIDPAPIAASFSIIPEPYRSVVMETVAEAQHNADLNLAAHMRDRLAAAGIAYKQSDQVWDNFVYIVRVVDQYLRSWRSTQLVECIKNLPVLIIGNGWDHIDKTATHATFLPSMPMEEIKKLFYRTKFLFNAHPYARYGWHERVIMGLEVGATVVTDRTRFTDAHFADLPNFIGFDWGNPNWRDDIMGAMAQRAGAAFDLGQAARRLREHFPLPSTATNMLQLALAMHKGEIPTA